MKLITGIAFPLATALSASGKRSAADIKTDIANAKALCTKRNTDKWVTFIDSKGVRKIAVVIEPVSRLLQGGCKLKLREGDYFGKPKVISWKNLHSMTSAADYCATPSDLPLITSSVNEIEGSCQFDITGRKSVLIKLLDMPLDRTSRSMPVDRNLLSERIRCMTGADDTFHYESAGNGHCTFVVGQDNVNIPMPDITTLDPPSSFLTTAVVRRAAAQHYCTIKYKSMNAKVADSACTVVFNGVSLSLGLDKFAFSPAGFDSAAAQKELDKLAEAEVKKRAFCDKPAAPIKPCPNCKPEAGSCGFNVGGVFVYAKLSDFPMTDKGEVDVAALVAKLQEGKKDVMNKRYKKPATAVAGTPIDTCKAGEGGIFHLDSVAGQCIFSLGEFKFNVDKSAVTPEAVRVAFIKAGCLSVGGAYSSFSDACDVKGSTKKPDLGVKSMVDLSSNALAKAKEAVETMIKELKETKLPGKPSEALPTEVSECWKFDGQNRIELESKTEAKSCTSNELWIAALSQKWQEVVQAAKAYNNAFAVDTVVKAMQPSP